MKSIGVNLIRRLLKIGTKSCQKCRDKLYYYKGLDFVTARRCEVCKPNQTGANHGKTTKPR